ncbi:unnamed protein product [Arabis nemorensis]|uniref:F-box associated beta-propeller type 3 domain-containing protein n=1 Tax=Arabis nemorensis TaxID=586526 RepID=A0A565ATP9_9BRAS|nr:unnamed protein product [Arabis nemorensis]
MSCTMRSRFMLGVLANGVDMRFFIFSSSHEEKKSDSLVANLDMTIPSLSLSRGSNCASVHGLIGFTNSGPFIVYNPSTKTVTTLSCVGARTYLDERISFITAPAVVVGWEGDSILMEYKGKLASIARHPYVPLRSFDLWILEDTKGQYWSKQTFELPYSLGQGKEVFSPGTNKAGDIVFAPRYLSNDVQPFFLFCYNVETKCIRRVRVHGIADSEEFRRHYGLAGECCIYISPEHIESIASI